MCGRYSLAITDPAQVRARFPIGESVEVRPRFNVSPADDVLAVTTDKEGRPRGELLRWGLIPPWSKDPRTGVKMINARAETLADRPAYRSAFERFRCLIPADGFYEWQHRQGGPKQAFHITSRDDALVAFAGLWSTWRSQERVIRSCTIITTAANATVAPLHDRMPVILPRDGEEAWLDAATQPQALQELLRGLSAEQTALREVSSAVNDARHDEPDCLASTQQPAALTLFQ